MVLFGGDPRYVPLQIILKFNVWVDVIVIPIILISYLFRNIEIQMQFICCGFAVFEIIRICLHKSHMYGNIPNHVAFVILTVFPCLILEVIYIFILGNVSPLDYVVMIMYLIIDILQIIFSIFIYRSFKKYQDGFFQFSREIQKNQSENTLLLDF